MTDRILPEINDTTTPQLLVSKMIDLPSVIHYGHVLVTDRLDPLDRPVKRVEVVTGGFSDNEQVVDELRRTSFQWLWWESSHRGGLHVYRVPVDMWTNPAMLFEMPEGDAA